MTVYLKQLLGDGLAGLDKSHGTDRLYELLEGMITQLNDQGAQFNTMRTEQLAAAGVVNNVLVDGGVVKDPTTPSSQLTGAGNTTWNVDDEALTAIINAVNGQVAAAADEAIHSGSELVANGESCYAWAVVSESGGTLDVEYVKGTAATTGTQVAPTDAEITTAVGNANWAKLALCLINRTGDTTVTQSQDLSARTMLANIADTAATAITVTAVAVE